MTYSSTNHQQERIDLAAAFRWAERLNMHEGVANHFSLAVNDDGTQFLLNPDQSHFSMIRASDLLLLDANDKSTLEQPNAPDPTAWGLHGSLHRRCPQARCALHVHSTFATVLASLADSTLPAVDQNAAMFFERVVVDESFGGLAFESEGERCAALFNDPKTQIMVMGNHGIMVIGRTVSEAFNRLYYFERAAENYIRALQTGQPLRIMPDEIARKVADGLDEYYGDYKHFDRLKEILDKEGSDYAD
ncbi:MAG: class II aldolase and adducin N-terminal domain-containing protein [Leucothrix sp.]